MLRGNAIAKVDDKGRLKVPSLFRAVIEPEYSKEFFVTSLRGESVRIYPIEVWRRIEERLQRASSFNPRVMRVNYAVNFYGQCATMDAQGRILIHPLLREKASIDGEVAVLGHQDYLEVWNRLAIEERIESEPISDADLAEIAALLT